MNPVVRSFSPNTTVNSGFFFSHYKFCGLPFYYSVNFHSSESPCRDSSKSIAHTCANHT